MCAAGEREPVQAGWRSGEGAGRKRTDVTDEAVAQAGRAAAKALTDIELRPDDPWERTCRRMARVAVEAAAPILAGELIAGTARLLERIEWAEGEVVRLREERDGLRRRLDGLRGPCGSDDRAGVEAQPGRQPSETAGRRVRR